MKKNVSTIALLVITALVAFACGTMVTDVTAEPVAERKYIGSHWIQGMNPVRFYVIYDSAGVVKYQFLPTY